MVIYDQWFFFFCSYYKKKLELIEGSDDGWHFFYQYSIF